MAVVDPIESVRRSAADVRTCRERVQQEGIPPEHRAMHTQAVLEAQRNLEGAARLAHGEGYPVDEIARAANLPVDRVEEMLG